MADKDQRDQRNDERQPDPDQLALFRERRHVPDHDVSRSRWNSER